MPTSHNTLAATPPALIDLACTLAEARREAARALRVRYVLATGAAWAVATEPPRDRRAYYRVYPGGRTEHHAAPRRRRA